MMKNLDKAMMMDVDYIELRVDTIDNVDSLMVKKIIQDIKSKTSIPLILTNRTPNEGGYFTAGEEERIKILKDNAPLVEITDIEYSTEESLRQSVIDNANQTIISYHNFEITPSKDFLQDIINESFKLGDIPKIALKPETIEDTFTLLKLVMDNQGIIGISMNHLGTYTRVVAPILGSPITYATITQESAPGQLNVNETSSLIKKLKP